MRTATPSVTACAVLATIWLVPAGGQPAQRPVTITIDFLATGHDGAPVTGLTADEITVRIGGRDRVVHALDLIATEAAEKRTPEAPPRPAPALPLPFGETDASSAPSAGGRNVLLLIDEGTLFGLEQVVKDAVAQLIASLGSRDRVGLASTRPGSVNVTLTTNHDAVTRGIDAMVFGRGDTALCVGALLSQVPAIAQALPRGRATTLALISRGSVRDNPGLPGGGPGAGCMFRRDQLPPVEAAVSATQVNYHVFHVGGAGTSPVLDNFAGSTGAESSVLSWSDASALMRAVRASSSFYRATVEAPAASGRQEHQRLELRVKRQGVRLRAPQHVASAPPATPAIDAGSLLRGDVSRADLPIRVAAFASRNPGPLPVRLVIVLEPVDASARLDSAMVSVVAADGEVAGQWTARAADLRRIPLVTAVPVIPGNYQVRGAITDEAGRGGMAEYSVSAVLTSGAGVTLSAMALGISTADGFSPRLLFGDEPAAVAYLEVYDAPPGASVSATFEMAAGPDAPAAASSAGQVTARSGIHMVTGSLPLASVPPGDTLVRATISIDGTAVGTVTRTLRRGGPVP